MHARLFFVACASAALLSAGACNDSRTMTNDQTANTTERTPGATPNAKGTSGSADRDRAAAQPITLTGCLQKGDGSDYILTEINEPKPGAAQSGENKIERERLNAAEHAYRLQANDSNGGKTSDLDALVGRQVRVTGTVAKRADLDQQVGTSGSNDRGQATDRVQGDRDTTPKIHESDLAQVDVNRIQQVAASCGGRAKGK